MALYDQRFTRRLVVYRRLQALAAADDSVLMDGIQTGNGNGNSDSELSIVSESRFAGLAEDWWEDSKASGIETTKKKKKVHWE